jgi:hypothetical protein
MLVVVKELAIMSKFYPFDCLVGYIVDSQKKIGCEI